MRRPGCSSPPAAVPRVTDFTAPERSKVFVTAFSIRATDCAASTSRDAIRSCRLSADSSAVELGDALALNDYQIQLESVDAILHPISLIHDAVPGAASSRSQFQAVRSQACGYLYDASRNRRTSWIMALKTKSFQPPSRIFTVSFSEFAQRFPSFHHSKAQKPVLQH